MYLDDKKPFFGFKGIDPKDWVLEMRIRNSTATPQHCVPKVGSGAMMGMASFLALPIVYKKRDIRDVTKRVRRPPYHYNYRIRCRYVQHSFRDALDYSEWTSALFL